MNQSFRSFGSGSTYREANPLLIPETNPGSDAGLEYSHGGVKVTANGFYNDLSNVVDSATICSNAKCTVAALAAGIGWQPMPALTLSSQFKAFPGYWYDTRHTKWNSEGFIVDLGAATKSPRRSKFS